jgi:hypothetical protein
MDPLTTTAAAGDFSRYGVAWLINSTAARTSTWNEVVHASIEVPVIIGEPLRWLLGFLGLKLEGG